MKRRLSEWLEQISVTDDAAHIVWFQELRRRTDYDIQELMALPGLELVTDLSDGVILRVKK